MRIFSSYLVALGLAAVGLSSCGRSSYSFQSKAPAYSGTAPIEVADTPSPNAAPMVVTTPIVQSAVVSTTPETTPVTNLAIQLTARTQPAEVPVLVRAMVTVTPAKTLKLPVGQRLLLPRILKQAARATVRQQNTARVTHTAAGKASLLVVIVGLIALVIGLIASSGFLITVGIIVAVIGFLLLLLKAL